VQQVLITQISWSIRWGRGNKCCFKFHGLQAGYKATSANNSNFLGNQAGYKAINASYSTLIGYNVGSADVLSSIGSNNIIIGTNISLPSATTNSINLGGVLFARNIFRTCW
jgi:hypothetical protein